MSIFSTAITLILVINPIGNIPAFISVLYPVNPQRRRWVILRECLIAYLILILFLIGGDHILDLLKISGSSLNIAGGIVLFLIAIKMIFPADERHNRREQSNSEPFITPLAVPLIAGPSALAVVTLLGNQNSELFGENLLALTIATMISAIILLSAEIIRKLLGQKGIVAMERLMGMLLTTIAVELFLTGIKGYFKL